MKEKRVYHTLCFVVDITNNAGKKKQVQNHSSLDMRKSEDRCRSDNSSPLIMLHEHIGNKSSIDDFFDCRSKQRHQDKQNKILSSMMDSYICY